MALPASGVLGDTTAGHTNTDFAGEIEDFRDFVAQMLGGSARTELTISGGAIVPPDGSGGGIFTVDTEGNAATDDLASITTTNLSDGALVMLYAENTSRVVTLKHGTGNLSLEDGLDLALTDLSMWVLFQLRSATFVEVARHNKRCGFLARVASNQTGVVTATWTTVTYDTEDVDYGGNFASSTFTAPATGLYHLSAVISTFTSITSGTNCAARFFKNGTTVIGGQRESLGGAHVVTLDITADVYLTKGNTVVVQFLHNHGSNVTLDADGTASGASAVIPMFFSGHRAA